MEFRRYLEVSARYWWVVLAALAVTAATTYKLVDARSPTYESSTTVVVRPRFTQTDDGARAFDALIRGVTINTTYAEIATSQLIRDRADSWLDPGARGDDASVSAEVITDTNIISIRARGRDPELVRDLAAGVSTETVAYVDGLADVYRLEPLDPPTLPDEPVDTRRTLTIGIGIVLGLMLGIVLAIFADNLRRPRSAGPPQPDDLVPFAPGQDGSRPRDALGRLTAEGTDKSLDGTPSTGNGGSKIGSGVPTPGGGSDGGPQPDDAASAAPADQ